MQLPEGFVSPG
ncbi:hypothetical protein RDI58_028799 [Solanum bulbocastanum]|uniref:Uncharacterized protein n=1 Tax=Solanum bulbocastanum TaxID=147425 RepID=A0AAN8XZC6_SOLBU